jgi:RNA polymerase sigma-70 factor (ECF subfamily)
MEHGVTDADLIARTRAGEPAALAELYRCYATQILTLATRLLGSTADAEDLLHDLFVGLPEALRRYEDEGKFSAWLRTVAVRMALMRLRSSRRRRETDLDAAQHVAGSASAPSLDAAAVERALAQLSPGLRAVFVRREIEGRSHQEIAELLNISTSASEARLSRAMGALRVTLHGLA